MKKNPKPVIIAYVLLSAVSLWSLFGAEDTRLKAGSVLVIGVAFLMLLISGDMSFGSTTLAFSLRYMAFVILLFVVAAVTYLVNLSETALISRGLQKLFFQFIVVLLAASAAYLFGEKAIHYTLGATVIFNVAASLWAVKLTGVSAAGESIANFISSGGEATGFMKYLEMHDAIFTYGFFILYFTFFAKKGKARIFALLASCFFFFIGFKRIGFLALALALLAGLLLKRVKARTLETLTVGIGAAMAIAGFLYIVAIRYGLFDAFTAMLGIDAMGRNELYAFIEPYYEISPAFFGHGFEFVTKLLETGAVGEKGVEGLAALHNGFLTQFVELGFWGFWLWEGFWLVYMTRFAGRFGPKTQLLYFVCTVYAFCTYLTDNTAFYFFTGTAYRLVPLAFACSQKQGELSQ